MDVIGDLRLNQCRIIHAIVSIPYICNVRCVMLFQVCDLKPLSDHKNTYNGVYNDARLLDFKLNMVGNIYSDS